MKRPAALIVDVGTTSAGQRVGVRLTQEASRALSIIGDIGTRDVEAAMRPALLRAKTTLMKQATRRIKRRYRVTTKVADFKDRMFRDRGADKMQISIKDRRHTLRSFAPRQTRKGVSFTIIRGNRRTWRGAFIPKRGNLQGIPTTRGRYEGNRYVPNSAGRRSRRGGNRSEMPIVPLLSPSSAAMFNSKGIRDASSKAAHVMFRRRLEHELNRRIVSRIR